MTPTPPVSPSSMAAFPLGPFEILRDPLWQGIGAIVGLITLFFMIREERNKWKIQSGVVSTANERLKYRTGKAGQSTDSEQGIIYYIFGFLFSLFWMVLIVHDSINIEVMISVLMIASFFIPALYTALGVIVFQAQLTTIRSFFFLALMMGIPLVALSIYVMVSSSSDSHSWFFLTFWGFLHILSSVFGAMIGLGVVNTLIALLF